MGGDRHAVAAAAVGVLCRLLLEAHGRELGVAAAWQLVREGLPFLYSKGRNGWAVLSTHMKLHL
jgi:hypothetical protein